MEKRVAVRYLVLSIIFIGLLGSLFILRMNFTGFAVFEQETRGEFDLGTYENTEYSDGVIKLVPGRHSGSYTSMVFDAGKEANWNHISWKQKGAETVLDVSGVDLYARSCDDLFCEGEVFIDVFDMSPQDLSLDNNRYFQYKFQFETDDTGYSPELYDVSINYKFTDSQPLITLTLPQETTYSYNESLDLEFVVSGDEIKSCWYNINGGENVTIANCENTKFNVAGDGNYVLNVYVKDSAGNVNSASSEFSVYLVQ